MRNSIIIIRAEGALSAKMIIFIAMRVADVNFPVGGQEPLSLVPEPRIRPTDLVQVVITLGEQTGSILASAEDFHDRPTLWAGKPRPSVHL